VNPVPVEAMPGALELPSSEAPASRAEENVEVEVGRPQPLTDPALIPSEDRPKYDHLITEDDTPLDNLFSERQQRLVTAPLDDSWPGPRDGRNFVTMANVGVFRSDQGPALVPDALLAVNVYLPVGDLLRKENRSYFVWRYGKPPDVVIEIVSNREGGEDGHKLVQYADMGVGYYAIFDPANLLGGGILRVFRLVGKTYQPANAPYWFPEIELGLTLWQGEFVRSTATWLRWCDADGTPILTGKERADREAFRAEQERQRAEQERQRAELQQLRAESAEAERDELRRQLAQLEARLRAVASQQQEGIKGGAGETP
jgi:Uma2 family endonuclease